MDLQSLNHLVYLYRRELQKDDKNQDTTAPKGVGLSKFDAPILLDITTQVMRGKRLSEKQIQVVLNRLRKYKKQMPPEGFDYRTYAPEQPVSDCLISDD